MDFENYFFFEFSVYSFFQILFTLQHIFYIYRMFYFGESSKTQSIEKEIDLTRIFCHCSSPIEVYFQSKVRQNRDLSRPITNITEYLVMIDPLTDFFRKTSLGNETQLFLRWANETNIVQTKYEKQEFLNMVELIFLTQQIDPVQLSKMQVARVDLYRALSASQLFPKRVCDAMCGISEKTRNFFTEKM